MKGSVPTNCTQRNARDSTCPAFQEKMSRRINSVVRYLITEVFSLRAAWKGLEAVSFSIESFGKVTTLLAFNAGLFRHHLHTQPT